MIYEQTGRVLTCRETALLRDIDNPRLNGTAWSRAAPVVPGPLLKKYVRLGLGYPFRKES